MTPAHLLAGLLSLAITALILISPSPAQDAAPPPPSAEEEAVEATPLKTLLVISAANHEGAPMAGIRFEVDQPGDAQPLVVTTNERGEAEIPDVEDLFIPGVRLLDDRYVATAPQTAMTGSATISAWRLFLRDIQTAEPEEREELARMYRELVTESAAASSFANDQVRTIAAFLTGGDRGSPIPSAPLPADDEEGTTGALSVRLIDGRGAPAEGCLVQLYSYQSSTSTITLFDYERTNAEGMAVFSNLEIGRTYRAEVLQDPNLAARSTIVRLTGSEPLLMPTMILRPRNQILSGVLVDGDGPAAGTLVTARRPSDGLLMTAATDSAGFFILGPFSTTEEVTLTFEQSMSSGVRTGVMAARPGGSELLVPLHVLAGDGPQ